MLSQKELRYRRSTELGKDQVYAREKDVVGMYIDTSKTYSQLAGGGLALCAAFSERLLGQTNWGEPDALLLAASLFFTLALLLSAAYQYLAVARIEDLSGLPVNRPRVPPWPRSHPFVFYRGGLAMFALGAICLAVLVWNRLF